MPTPSALGSASAGQYFEAASLDIVSLDQFQKILDSGDLDLTSFKEDMSYLGFDKQKIARLAAKNLGPKLTIKLLYLGAMRGTNLKKILSKSVKVDADVKNVFDSGKILSGGTGANDLTMGRLMGTFPEIAAYYALKFPISKKIEEEECPSALQWPAAASLPMSPEVRIQHVKFSRRFSEVIGSQFEERYYRAAFNGQLSVNRLDPIVLQLCGSPSDHQSSSLDLEEIFLDTKPGGVKLGKKRALAMVPPQVPPG
jgi:hypothetical protein